MPTVDLLVIGGGIHGACVARDAALRGLSVVLVEKGDLASGTSSRSSKLIHGGLRYLETGQFGLVREALRERAILLKTAHGLVQELPFVLPFYDGDARPAWLVRLGLTIYDRLAGAHDLPPHRRLSVDEALALEPDLPRAGLRGAALYHDAQMNDAALVVANAMSARDAGATIRTYTEVLSLTRSAGETWRATVRDSGAEETIEARTVVNAAGPWLDRVRAQAGVAAPTALRVTRGTHIVVPSLTRSHALLLFARRDRRVFFVVPRFEFSLVGTTDTDVPADFDPADVAPTVEDIRYLWDEIAARWPEHEAARNPAAVTTRAFAGLRPLARGSSARPWDNSREARILDEDGLMSLAGGKYTTARSLAERTVDRVVARLGRNAAPCSTAHASLPNPPGGHTKRFVEAMVDQALVHRIDDVLERRMQRPWLEYGNKWALAPHVAYWMGERLGWSDEFRKAEVARVENSILAERDLIKLAASRS